jgi:hypothetical protein
MIESGVGYCLRDRLADILVDVRDDASHQCMLEPLVERLLPPGVILLPRLPFPLHGGGELDQPLGGVRPAVEKDILDMFLQIGRDLVVDDELSRVDDPHVHPGADGVVQKRGVHRLAHRIVAAERERDIAHAAADLHLREEPLQLAGRLDVGHSVAVVLLDPGADRQDVRVEDDLARLEADVVDEDATGA